MQQPHLKPAVPAAARLLVLPLGEGAILHVAGAAADGALKGVVALRPGAEVDLLGRLLVAGFALPLARGLRLHRLLGAHRRALLVRLLQLVLVLRQGLHRSGICAGETGESAEGTQARARDTAHTVAQAPQWLGSWVCGLRSWQQQVLGRSKQEVGKHEACRKEGTACWKRAAPVGPVLSGSTARVASVGALMAADSVAVPATTCECAGTGFESFQRRS